MCPAVHSSSTATVTFEDAVVPKENLLGKLGLGFKIAMTTLDSGLHSTMTTSSSPD